MPSKSTAGRLVDVPRAILSRGLTARLDAIIRRHGGEPKPIGHAGFRLPIPGRRHCKGQLTLFEVGK